MARIMRCDLDRSFCFSGRRRHTGCGRDWSSDVCSSDLVSTTRGCPYKCNWCAKPLYGQTYSTHSPQRVADQFRYLKDNFNVDHIWITDDIFGLKPGDRKSVV